MAKYVKRIHPLLQLGLAFLVCILLGPPLREELGWSPWILYPVLFFATVCAVDVRYQTAEFKASLNNYRIMGFASMSPAGNYLFYTVFTILPIGILLWMIWRLLT